METDKNDVTKKAAAGRAHKLSLDSHKLLSVSGVKNVPTFTEKGISIGLDGEKLEIIGRDLQITHLDVDAGTLSVTGYVTAMKYVSGDPAGGFIKKLLK